MRIIGFNLIKILVERKEKLDEELKITQNINIKDVSTEKIIVTKDEAIKIKFNLSIGYSGGKTGSEFKNSEENAKLEFEGFVIILAEKDELKMFLKEWKDKKIPEEFKIPIFNFIMGKCNIKALSLEDELVLPLHFQMPRLQQGNMQTKN